MEEKRLVQLALDNATGIIFERDLVILGQMEAAKTAVCHHANILVSRGSDCCGLAAVAVQISEFS